MDGVHYTLVSERLDAVARREERVEALDETGMAPEELGHPLNHSRRVNPAVIKAPASATECKSSENKKKKKH